VMMMLFGGSKRRNRIKRLRRSPSFANGPPYRTSAIIAAASLPEGCRGCQRGAASRRNSASSDQSSGNVRQSAVTPRGSRSAGRGVRDCRMHVAGDCMRASLPRAHTSIAGRDLGRLAAALPPVLPSRATHALGVGTFDRKVASDAEVDHDWFVFVKKDCSSP